MKKKPSDIITPANAEYTNYRITIENKPLPELIKVPEKLLNNREKRMSEFISKNWKTTIGAIIVVIGIVLEGIPEPWYISWAGKGLIMGGTLFFGVNASDIKKKIGK